METIVVAVFLTLFLSDLAVELTLNELNLSHARRESVKRTGAGLFDEWVTPEVYRRSVEYALAKGRFQRWESIYDGLVVLWALFGGMLPYLDRLTVTLGGFFPSWTHATGILFCFGVAAVFSLLGLPGELYATFVIEERFGFNKSTLRLFFTDRLKGLVLGVAIGAPFLFGVLWLMDGAGRYWWLWAFFFVFAFQCLMVIAYPALIAPLFNKFEPLPEGELRQRISALAREVGFQAGEIYTMDGSKRSAHSNAYFTGLGKAKRIVLFDTLIKQLTIEQGLAVLAHEVGHYKMRHIRRMMLLRGVLLLAGSYILSLLLDYAPLFRAFGLAEPSRHGALVLFSLLSGPATFYLRPLMNFLSRRHEYEADLFAASTLKDGKPMEGALIRLTIENLANLTPHPWYSAYHYSHPTPAERIRALAEKSGLGPGGH